MLALASAAPLTTQLNCRSLSAHAPLSWDDSIVLSGASFGTDKQLWRATFRSATAAPHNVKILSTDPFKYWPTGVGEWYGIEPVKGARCLFDGCVQPNASSDLGVWLVRSAPVDVSTIVSSIVSTIGSGETAVQLKTDDGAVNRSIRVSSKAGKPRKKRAAWNSPVVHTGKTGSHKKIAVYYSGWQLVGQRLDQPTPGDTIDATRIKSLVQRGFTHVMMEDGNLELNHAVEPLDTLRFLGEHGLASFMVRFQ